MSNKEWGTITWIFFHTLAEQINENKFDKVKPLMIKIVTDTCHHLPCPFCRKDATNIIKQAYINRIQTN